MSIIACSADECEDVARLKGMCSKHYQRARRADNPPRVYTKKAKPKCSIEGCERTFLARGWCGTHYTQWRKTGSTETTRFIKRPCGVKGCPNLSARRGWCDTHYRRWAISGDVQADKPIARAKSPIVDGRKECRGCAKWLPISAFNGHSHGSGGVHHKCRDCQRMDNVAYREANPTYWQQWQKDNVQKTRDIANRRRAHKLSREHEKIDRDIIFERDNFECKLCMKPLDMSAKFPHPWSPTLDHIQPLSKGGHHLYVNLQAAHFRCNTTKGDRVA